MAVETFNVNFTTTGKSLLLKGVDETPLARHPNHEIWLVGFISGVGAQEYTTSFQYAVPSGASATMTQSQSINVTDENFTLEYIQFLAVQSNNNRLLYAQIDLSSSPKVFEFGGVVNISSLVAAITDAF